MLKSLSIYAFALAQRQVVSLVLVVVMLPWLSACLAILLRKKMNPGWIVSVVGFLQLILSGGSLLAAGQGITFHHFVPWFSLQKNQVFYVGIYGDLLTALLLLMISLVSWIVYIYSIGYLKNDVGKQRYFILLSLFVSAVLWVVVAGNLWSIYLGWELMSVISCLLISFWYQTAATPSASIQAWFISKLGSTCLLVGILLLVGKWGNGSFLTFAQAALFAIGETPIWLSIASLCFLIAALTKAAQFPFFNWLPRAMVAPTPVSALLHTTTLLSIGVYLLIRLQPILTHEARTTLVIVGHITACMGACAALAQQHIKRMLAYSTISQVGYVIAAMGLQALGVGTAYLLGHALAKTCLFLCAGVVTQFLQQQGVKQQNAHSMSYMGGIAYYLPGVAVSYLIAVLELGGLPGLTGSVAKEVILEKTLSWSLEIAHLGYDIAYLVPVLGFMGTFLTTLYLGKSFLRIFFGAPTWKSSIAWFVKSSSCNRTSWLMQGSILACVGCIGIFSLFSSSIMDRIDEMNRGSAHLPLAIATVLPIHHLTRTICLGLLLIAIILLGILFSKSKNNLALPANNLFQLFLNGWYLDTIATLVARQVLVCSKWMANVEKWFVQGFIDCLTIGYIRTAYQVAWLDAKLIASLVDGIATMLKRLRKLYLQVQAGSIQRHVAWSCISMLLLLLVWVVCNNFLM